MQITLSSIGKVYKEGKWPKMKVAFTRDGKDQERTLVAVGETKEVMKALQGYKAGDTVEIKIEKDGDFYNWVGLEAVAAGSVAKSSGGNKTFETPDERARRQVYIVRQFSINAAIEYAKGKNTKADQWSLDDVFKTASLISSYVFATQGAATVDEAGLEDVISLDDAPEAPKKVKAKDGFDDDIPF